MVRDNIDILLITENKIDGSFPIAQFQTDRYLLSITTPYGLDRDSSNSGRMLLYVRDDIPSKVLENTDFGNQTEAFFVEITIGKVKWLISCSYNPHKANIENIYMILVRIFIYNHQNMNLLIY